MQKLRGSARRPVVFFSLSAQDEKPHWLRQPMHSAWSTRISFSSSGDTKIKVSSGVFIALVKPRAYHSRAWVTKGDLTHAREWYARGFTKKFFFVPTPTSSWK